MTWDVPVDPDEAISWFRARVPMTREAWDALSAEARDKAFMVSGVAQLDVVTQAFDAVDRAISQGTDLTAFKEAVAQSLKAAWAGSVEDPAWRIECLSGDTPVSGAVVRAAHRRWFEGDVIEIVTASGRKFTTTPNHPMLTRHGWKASGELSEADDLVGYRRQQHVGADGHSDNEEPHACIAEVFEALAASRPLERVLCGPLDFHGDGADGQVNVVRPDRELTVGAFAPLRQPVGEHVFAKADLAASCFCDACGHLRLITERCGFCDRPVVCSVAHQDALDGVIGRAELETEGVRTFPRFVSANNLAGGQVVSDNRGLAPTGEVLGASLATGPGDASLVQHEANPALGHTDHSGDIAGALPGEIEFDRVVSATRRHFSGHVFNLSTPYGYFLIDGLFTGNTIFRTNIQNAYARGRYEQATDPVILAIRPYWLYDATLDGRTTEVCKACDGTILPADDPWWNTRHPPNHFQCRSSVTTLTAEQAQEMGVSTNPPMIEAHEGFGVIGEDWKPRKADYPKEMQGAPVLNTKTG